MAGEDKSKEVIRLTAGQVAWLDIIAPKSPHAEYVALRKAENPSGRDALFDNGDFSRFVTGKSGCRRELAETVFHAYGTSYGQMKLIEEWPFIVAAECADDSPSEVLDEFLRKCGVLLWQGSDAKSPFVTFLGKATSPNLEPILLDMVSSVLEHRRNLNAFQRSAIFGELLDYLYETRQYTRWPQWMIALSRQPNRYLFKRIRAKPDSGVFFPGGKKDAAGTVHYDLAAIENLSKEELDECAYFVRRVNMRINEIRFDNFKREQEEFDAIFDKLSSSPKSTLFEALRELTDLGKCSARNYFAWARENVKPFLEAVRKSSNENRWYFLVCATRLMYDWARWHYYSTEDDDRKNACEMYRDIRDLADECFDDNDATDKIRCRFAYMAATACRYMAEGTSEGIWRGDATAADYASAAIRYARGAVDVFKKASREMGNGGEKRALNYRFNRNYARILTFAARWWLMHPNKRGMHPHMESEDPDYPDNYGVQLLEVARECHAESVFLPMGPDCGHDKGPVVLYGKRQLEYEFHLRVCIEMLAHHFSVDMQYGVAADLPSRAMRRFCEMILIYDHLFKSGKPDGLVGKRFTELHPDTVRSAREWLLGHEAGSFEDYKFDVSQLNKTLQGAPPSLEETRFEIICAFMFNPATERVAESALWGQLVAIEDGVNSGKPFSEEAVDFVRKIWRPASTALKADFDETCYRMRRKTAQFEREYTSPEQRVEKWKDYPPFRYWFKLVAAPGNNPNRVKCLLRRFGMGWDHLEKGESGGQKEAGAKRGPKRKKKFREISKEEREQLLKMIFGPWRERKELNDVLFPNSEAIQRATCAETPDDARKAARMAAKSRTASMTQFMNRGKSSGEIEAALKVLLSIDPMAGAPNMAAFGKDKAIEGEFSTDVMVFKKNAARYLKRISQFDACQNIEVATIAIEALACDLDNKAIGHQEATMAMSTLWHGITALLEGMGNVPFSLLRDLGKSIHDAVSASSKHCKLEIKTFHAVAERHAKSLWRHASLGPAEARTSFNILAELTGRRIPPELTECFCASFPSERAHGYNR